MRLEFLQTRTKELGNIQFFSRRSTALSQSIFSLFFLMSSLESVIALLAQLPPGTNPYPLILQSVIEKVYPPTSNSFFIQLYLITALDSLIVLSCILSLSAHYYKGTFWIARIKNAPNGNFIVTNGLLGWQVPGCIFFIGSIVYIAEQILHSQGHYVHGFTTMSFLVWMPAFFSGWCVLMNTAAGYLLKLNNSGSLFVSGLLFNSIAIAVPILNILSLIPFGVITQNRATAAEKAFEEMQDFLTIASNNFNPKTFSIAEILPLLVPAKVLKDASDSLLRSVTVVGSILASWALFLLVLGLVFSTLQLRSLSRDIARAESYGCHRATERSGTWGAKGAAVRSTYYMLIAIISTFSFMTLNFAACSLYIAIDPRDALGKATSIEGYTLTVLYSFTIPGFCIMTAILHQSFKGIFKSKANASQVCVVNAPQTATTTFPWMTYDDAAERASNELEIRSKFMAIRTMGINFEEKGGLNLELVALDERKVTFK